MPSVPDRRSCRTITCTHLQLFLDAQYSGQAVVQNYHVHAPPALSGCPVFRTGGRAELSRARTSSSVLMPSIPDRRSCRTITCTHLQLCLDAQCSGQAVKQNHHTHAPPALSGCSGSRTGAQQPPWSCPPWPGGRRSQGRAASPDACAPRPHPSAPSPVPVSICPTAHLCPHALHMLHPGGAVLHRQPHVPRGHICQLHLRACTLTQVHAPCICVRPVFLLGRGWHMLLQAYKLHSMCTPVAHVHTQCTSELQDLCGLHD